MARPYIPPASYNTSSRPWSWTGAVLLTVIFVTVLALWPPVFGPLKEAQQAPQWVLFFGRFHPIAVHLPIGVLILSILLELGCLRPSVEERWGDMALFTLFVASIGGVIAVIFGIFLAREGGYEGGAFILHQALGIATAVGTLVALFFRLSFMSSGGRGLLLVSRLALFGTMGVMSIGAHFGANMVHGSKYLTQYAPEQMAAVMAGAEKWLLALVEKKIAPKPVLVEQPLPDSPPPGPKVPSEPMTAANNKLVFQHVLLPILEAKCNNCHNADKSKGGLRMDTYELALQGGDSGNNIVPGKPTDSLAVQRVELPIEDDEHMPPDGKDQLTTEELTLLKWWIEQGASDKLKISDAKFPPTVQPLVDAALKSVASHP